MFGTEKERKKNTIEGEKVAAAPTKRLFTSLTNQIEYQGQSGIQTHTLVELVLFSSDLFFILQVSHLSSY